MPVYPGAPPGRTRTYKAWVNSVRALLLKMQDLRLVSEEKKQSPAARIWWDRAYRIRYSSWNGVQADSVWKSEPAKEGDGSDRLQLFLRTKRYSLPCMNGDNKVVPFPPPAGSPEPEPIAKRHQRVILSIGSQRLAFDFYHEVTKLNPAPAPVIPVDHSKPRKGRKPRK